MRLKSICRILPLAVCLLWWATPVSAGLLTFDFAGGDNGGFAGDAAWAFTGTSWNLTGVNNLRAGLSSPVLTATGGAVNLQFTHTRNFEASWDGGVLGLSVGGGAYTYIPAGSFTSGGYTNTASIDSGVNTALGVSGGGNVMYSGSGTLSSAVLLGNLAPGTSFQFRYYAAGDASVVAANPNWRITAASVDGVVTNDVNQVPEPATFCLLAAGLATLGALRRRRS